MFQWCVCGVLGPACSRALWMCSLTAGHNTAGNQIMIDSDALGSWFLVCKTGTIRSAGFVTVLHEQIFGAFFKMQIVLIKRSLVISKHHWLLLSRTGCNNLRTIHFVVRARTTLSRSVNSRNLSAQLSYSRDEGNSYIGIL